MKNYALLCLLALVIALSMACGGGGGAASTSTSTTTTTTAPVAPALVITTNTTLPGALQGHPYSTTLVATGGTGALHWSFASSSSSFSTTSGLSLDANSGVLSGTASFAGSTGFIAQVTDSASPTKSISQPFNITAYGPLTAGSFQPQTVAEYQFPSFGFSSTIAS